MQFLVVLAALCLASPVLCSYNSGYNYGGYNQGGYNGPQASPVVTPNGFLADTPEVAAAKAAHFSEVAKAKSGPGHYSGYAAPSAGHADQYDDGSYKPELYERESGSYSAPAHSGAAYSAPAYSAPAYSGAAYSAPAYSAPAYSAPAYTRPGYSAPAYSAPAYSGAAYSAPTGGYKGPLAKPVVTPSGFLADTPEVAAAKAAHFSEVAKSQSYGSHGRYRRGVNYVAASVYPYAQHVYYL